MSSAAKTKFDALVQRAELICSHAGKLKSKKDATAKTVFLHAALTTQVAAWDVYVKAVSLEYFSATSSPANARYTAMHTLLQARMSEAAKKLNTPNSDNCRNHLLTYSGFDPWPCWINIKFGTTLLSSSLLIRNRVDEIFSLRHSFAHGLSMPAHSWNSDVHGKAHLSCSVIKQTGKFLTEVCKKTDMGFAQHIATQHAIPRPW